MGKQSLLLAALMFSGCVIQPSNSPDPLPDSDPGDITFYWSFAGRTCSQAREVLRVRISLFRDGVEVRDLPDEGYFKCSPAGVDGITLTNFNPGPYSYRIDALDSANQVIYTANGSFRVNGNVRVDVNLVSVSNLGRMQIYWKFLKDGVEKTCASAGIASSAGVGKVRVYINDEPVQELDCTLNDSSGKPVQAWAWELNPASYQVAIEGVVVAGQQRQVWYYANQTINVIPNQTRNVTFELLPVAAGASFIPKLPGYSSCATAGVETLWMQLSNPEDPAATVDRFSTDCNAVLRDGFFWDYIPASQTYSPSTGRWLGRWNVTIEAWDKAQTNHRVVARTTKQVEVQAGYQDQSFPLSLEY